MRLRYHLLGVKTKPTRKGLSPLLPSSKLKPLTEEWYHFWLTKPIQFQSYRAEDHVAAFRDKAPKVKLSAQLERDPLAALDAHTRDHKLAEHCLNHYIRTTLIPVTTVASRDEKRDACVRDNGGGRAFRWLIEDGKLMGISPDNTHLVVEAVIFCIAASRRTSLVWRALTTVKDRVRPPRWKADMFCALLLAESYWANPRKPLDEPLRSYIRSYEMLKGKYPGSMNSYTLPVVPLGIGV
jgi:hypothetical protein